MSGDDGRIFISYRREDTRYAAGRLADILSTYCPVFMDLDDIGPGQGFAELIANAVDQCRFMLVLIGPGWLKAADDAGRRRIDLPDDWVAHEIRMGLRQRSVPVIPAPHRRRDRACRRRAARGPQATRTASGSTHSFRVVPS